MFQVPVGIGRRLRRACSGPGLHPTTRPPLAPERDLCGIDCPPGFKKTRGVSRGLSDFPECRQKLCRETPEFTFSQIWIRRPPKATANDDVTAVGVVSAPWLLCTGHLPCRSRWMASGNGTYLPRLRALGVLLERRIQSPAGMAVRDDGFSRLVPCLEAACYSMRSWPPCLTDVVPHTPLPGDSRLLLRPSLGAGLHICMC